MSRGLSVQSKDDKTLILPAGTENSQPFSPAKEFRCASLERIDKIIKSNASIHLHLVFLIAARAFQQLKTWLWWNKLSSNNAEALIKGSVVAGIKQNGQIQKIIRLIYMIKDISHPNIYTNTRFYILFQEVQIF